MLTTKLGIRVAAHLFDFTRAILTLMRSQVAPPQPALCVTIAAWQTLTGQRIAIRVLATLDVQAQIRTGFAPRIRTSAMVGTHLETIATMLRIRIDIHAFSATQSQVP